jgi:2-oxo-4-hydroxy-4-carboxy--5-ureidoimidazoline (OHCU) decarboxylase
MAHEQLVKSRDELDELVARLFDVSPWVIEQIVKSNDPSAAERVARLFDLPPWVAEACWPLRRRVAWRLRHPVAALRRSRSVRHD